MKSTPLVHAAGSKAAGPRSDRELIEAARRGSDAGFEQLVRRYQDRLYSALCNDLDCPALAEDIAQEAFVNAYRFLNRFKLESNFYTWLFRIALNARHSHLRRRRPMTSIDSVNQRGIRSVAPRPGPAERLERLEQRDQVRAALARLDDGHRAILILREYEGFDYRAIAEILQIKVGTVRSRLARARAQLREQLAPYFAG